MNAPTRFQARAAAVVPQPEIAPACGSCRYFHSRLDGRDQCRIRPPVVLQHADDAPETVWPRVLSVDWCGMFKPQATS